MPRGETVPIGTRRKTQNGYWTTKTGNGWEFDHRIIAEQTLGRPLQPTERVLFLNGNKDDLDPDNISVETSRKRRNRVIVLEQKVDKMLNDLQEVKNELELLRENEST